ncbi:MAG TPA: MBL fold metallo-hydrolase [Motilibacteraceae bacterium]|nr:MBL fold metallo-hydrolase [Motilibacteraceae bacterium]
MREDLDDVGLSGPWIHGAPPGRPCTDPPLQVHRVDEATVVLRQSKALTYEAPFLFLLFGSDRALLLDTGDVADPGRMPLRRVVDGLVEDWLARHPRPGYQLVVAHTHGHGDHVAGDGQFAGRPDTTVVGQDVVAVRQFFGLTDWPRQVVPFDLGGRVLEVTGCPGHHPASIAVLDPATGFLLTGDTVYPGRLYVQDPPAFRESLDALVELAQTRGARAVVGCHVEMSRSPGRDYPIGTRYQPDEAPLPMSVDRLRAVRDAAHAVGDRPGVHTLDDVAIWVGPCRPARLRQGLRLAAGSTRARLGRTTR